MKILKIAQNVIVRNLRDVSTMLIMCAMPLVLIFVLGMSFDSMMGSGSGITLADMNIRYSIVGEETDFSAGVVEVIDGLLSEESVITLATDKDRELERLKNSQITCFVEIDETNSTITLYKNNLNNNGASFLEGVLGTFVDRYNVVYEIIKVNPQALANINLEEVTPDYAITTSLDASSSPGAMDYYGVMMSVLFVLYGYLSPLLITIENKNNGIASRIGTTSVKSREIFIGETLGYVGVSVIRTAIVIGVSSMFYGVNWGDKPLYPMLLILTLIILMTSLGLALGHIFKSEGPASSISHIIIVISGFFGGAYISLEDMGSAAQLGKYTSVIWWTNTGIMNQIYLGDYTSMYKAMALFLGLSLVFFAIAIRFMNKQEVK